MTPLGYLVIVCTVGLPIAWFASEFRSRLWVRLCLGVGAILMCFGVAFIVGTLNRLNYNAWYGSATAELIDATVSEVEAGRTDGALLELKQLRKEFQPTYENRAHYDVLVEGTISRIKARSLASQPEPSR